MKKKRNDTRIVLLDTNLNPIVVLNSIAVAKDYLNISKHVIHNRVNKQVTVNNYYLKWAEDYEKENNVLLPGCKPPLVLT